MKTILIPIDLIGDTENVLHYAVDLACNMHVERIILLKSYYVSVYEQVLPTPDFVQVSADEVEDKREIVERSLKTLGDKVQKTCPHGVQVETVFSSLPMLRAVHNTIAEKQPTVVMLGSDESTHQAGSYLGEQIIAIAKTSPIPVLVVPENAKFHKIEQVLVPCDFSVISRLTALQDFHRREHWATPHLTVLNVDPKYRHLAGNQKITDNLAEMLQEYEYEVHHSEDKDITEGVLGYARHHKIQMIIALPGKYSFFYNLTHKSITKAIALNSAKPVLILK